MSEDDQNQPAPVEREGGSGAKTLVSWIIILIIIAGGAFLLFADKSKDSGLDENDVSTEMPVPGSEGIDEMIVIEEKTITYTDNGFSPKEITIQKGESVIFINESRGEMWVGSAMHPTHEVYPIKSDNDCLGSTFDQCEASGPGATWTFQFDAVGEHGYHNHFQANHFGKVIVK